MAEWPVDAPEPRNKKEHIARYERKKIVLSFTGFAQLVTPGHVIDLKIAKIAKFCLVVTSKSFAVRDTREEVCF